MLSRELKKRAAEDARQFAVLDVEFHIALAKASGNALIFDLVSMIRNHLVRVLPKVLLLPNALPLSTREHIAIVTAVVRRDSDAARTAMHAHLGAVLRRYAIADKCDARSSGVLQVNTSGARVRIPRTKRIEK